MSDDINYEDFKHENTENTDVYCEEYPSKLDNTLNYSSHIESKNNFPLDNSSVSNIRKSNNNEQETEISKPFVNKEENTDQEVCESFVCDICSAAYKSLNSLSAHKRKHTAKGRVLSCVSCGKVFKKISHLKRHELTHDTEKPYKCMLCLKSYKKMVLLEEHLNRHRDGVSHKCPFCPKTYWHLATLASHVKRHTKSMPCLCPVCGKKFSSPGNLKQHQLRHTGEKHYACDMCPRKFVSKGKIYSSSSQYLPKSRSGKPSLLIIEVPSLFLSMVNILHKLSVSCHSLGFLAPELSILSYP